MTHAALARSSLAPSVGQALQAQMQTCSGCSATGATRSSTSSAALGFRRSLMQPAWPYRMQRLSRVASRESLVLRLLSAGVLKNATCKTY